LSDRCIQAGDGQGSGSSKDEREVLVLGATHVAALLSADLPHALGNQNVGVMNQIRFGISSVCSIRNPRSRTLFRNCFARNGSIEINLVTNGHTGIHRVGFEEIQNHSRATATTISGWLMNNGGVSRSFTRPGQVIRSAAATRATPAYTGLRPAGPFNGGIIRDLTSRAGDMRSRRLRPDEAVNVV
jgi:hypothetical protein